MVKESDKRIRVAKLAPHDLGRTCARLSHASGEELEQIQFLLGHVSVQTTRPWVQASDSISPHGSQWHQAESLRWARSCQSVADPTRVDRVGWPSDFPYQLS
jgi:hypothetical protein